MITIMKEVNKGVLPQLYEWVLTPTFHEDV